MKNLAYRSLGLAFFLALPMGAAAAESPQASAPGTPAAAVSAAPGDYQTLRDQQREARKRFRQKQDQDRKAFHESLAGKSPEDKKASTARFHAQQKAERAAFNKDEQDERRAFRAAHPVVRSHRPARRDAADGR